MLNKSIRLNIRPPSFTNPFPEKPKANIVDVFQKLTGDTLVKISGKTTLVRCCFHKEDTPSLALYPNTSSYFCFGCNKGGDYIDLVMKICKVDFKEALEIIKKL